MNSIIAFCYQGTEVTPSLHDKTIRWIWLLNQDFEYLPDTFSLTVSILDRFLSLVKVRAVLY